MSTPEPDRPEAAGGLLHITDREYDIFLKPVLGPRHKNGFYHSPPERDCCSCCEGCYLDEPCDCCICELEYS